MEILNVGPLELLIILALMFIVLGPKDMVKTAQRIGRWVRSVTHSEMWREIWGISQDIRELPKKLMEDTGLEEALTDVKQTTQEVANELNTQLKEATEAARIPEVEHIRVENPLTTPPPGTVPAALPSTASQPAAIEAAADTVETPVGEATPGTDPQPAVLEVAEPAVTAESVVKNKPRRKKQAETAGTEGPVKKPRRKKQSEAWEQPTGEETAPVETPAAEDLTTPEAPALVEGSSNGSQPEAAAPVEPVKKQRRKKQVLVVTLPVEVQPAAEEPPQVAELTPAIHEYPPVDQPVKSSPAEAEAPAAPAAVKKSRRKKEAPVAETTVRPAELAVPPEPVPGPAAEKRRARARKTAPVSTAPVVADGEAVLAATNGQTGKNGTEPESVQQPLPRKRRTSRSAPADQPEPSKQPDQNAA